MWNVKLKQQMVILHHWDVVQTISFSFSPSGKFIASGGMQKKIFLWNLNDAEQQQKKDVPFKVIPRTLSIKKLHSNYIDDILWLVENFFITKSCDGDILIWKMEKLEETIQTNQTPKIVKYHTLLISECDLW